MNVKILAGIVAAVVVLAAAGWFILSRNTSDDDSLVIVAKANTDGSGIFADTSISITTDPDTGVMTPVNWGGKIFATPGSTSIQHMMLQDLVENTFHMTFQLAPADGSTPDNGTVYYVILGVGAMKESFESLKIDGGIVWEPVFSDILSSEMRAVHSVTTSHDLSPGHVCCVLAVNSSYLESHNDDMVRFLSAYAEVVDWMNEALETPGSSEYNRLVEMAKSFTGKSDAIVNASFAEVNYRYDLTGLEAEIVDLAETYERIGLVSKKLQDIGYENGEAFADALVDDSYLISAAAKTAADYADAPRITIKMAHLVQDIHQLALYVGSSAEGCLGTFDAYNITVDQLTPFAAGGEVAQSLIRGDANIGFLGAPPVVQNTINMG